MHRKIVLDVFGLLGKGNGYGDSDVAKFHCRQSHNAQNHIVLDVFRLLVRGQGYRNNVALLNSTADNLKMQRKLVLHAFGLLKGNGYANNDALQNLESLICSDCLAAETRMLCQQNHCRQSQDEQKNCPQCFQTACEGDRLLKQ